MKSDFLSISIPAGALLLALLVVFLAASRRVFRSRRFAGKMRRFWPGKVVAITGARTGMGKACALLAARYGSNLVLTSRNADQLSDVAKECRTSFPPSSNSRIAVCSFDLDEPSDPKKLLDTCIQAFGRLDVLIMSAADVVTEICLHYEGPEDRLKRFRHCCDINLLAQIRLITFALPVIRQSRGTVCFISSASGKIGSPCGEIFTATKHAMHGYLDSIRDTYADGVRICLPCPVWTQTESIMDVEGPDIYAKATPVAISARKIMEAVATGMPERIIGWDMYVSLLLRLWFPDAIRRWVHRDSPKEVLDAVEAIRQGTLSE